MTGKTRDIWKNVLKTVLDESNYRYRYRDSDIQIDRYTYMWDIYEIPCH